MLPLRCSRPSISVSKSSSFCPSTIARRRSSGCVALISMRFIQSPLMRRAGLGPRRHSSPGRMPCGARPIHDAGETLREPVARIALDCVADGPDGPSSSAALARACQRSACVSCGVGPGRRIVSSGHAATRAAPAWRREQRQAWERVTVDNMRRGVAGRGCKAGRLPSRTWNFRVPLKAGFLLRVSCAGAPGRRVTWGPRPTSGGTGIASPAHAPPRGPCGLTLDPGVRRVNSGKSSTYGSIVDRRIIGGKGRSGARRPLPAPVPAAMPAVKAVTPAAPQVLHLRSTTPLPASGSTTS